MLPTSQTQRLWRFLVPTLVVSLLSLLSLTGLAAAAGKPYRIYVTSPRYCSAIKGNTTIDVAARGFKQVTAKCWQQGPGFGHNSTVATVKLTHGHGSFVFPADKYPNGPVTVFISAARGGHKDICYLQLFNKGGVVWDQGLPKSAPPGAKGMKLIFADDFTGPLSIGPKDKDTFYDHKPPHGVQDFSWPLRFTNFSSPHNPFKQVGTWLRIRADQHTESTGLISSVHSNGKGITARVPCYFECRFIAPNAPGAWPAFWLLTDNLAVKPSPTPGDELDIFEGYGGNGPHHPNPGDGFMITPHCWNYPNNRAIWAIHAVFPYPHVCLPEKFGIPCTWYQTFNTYGCRITARTVTYYVDNIPVGHHPTPPMSKKLPLYFLINLATGGGWPVNLSRYDGLADMYVDWVRVYGRK